MEHHEKDGKTKRILTIYHKLCNGEVVNKTKMAELFQVNLRSIQRDIDLLRKYFASEDALNSYTDTKPIILYDRKKRGYYLEDHAQKMNIDEIFAICKIILASRAFSQNELSHILTKFVLTYSPTAEKKIM